MERVWGGRDFEKKLGREIPENKVIGEAWEICDRPEAENLIVGGKFDGKTIRQAIESDAEYIMGKGWAPSKKFPILVKWLDCQERLSLQVHPPASVAASLGGEPKTENWYVADCKDGAGLIAGLKKGATKADFVASLADNSAEKLVHRFPVKKGDSIFVQSGRIHAIDGGNLILEIQQNSDTTYRVYDWGRVGLDGKPRKLHVEESIASIDFSDFEPSPIHVEGSGNMCECKEFRIDVVRLNAGEVYEIKSGEAMRIVSVAEGELSDDEGEEVKFSENIVVPFAESVKFTATKPSTLLITR
ncbi:class I mannose-6-phosphate isomerase [Opitutales bacterium CLA-KB-P66]|uniref:Class I mannose-6-phosphate isomerase n=2 Tax=Intestinicryptomonas porci TaxID=2926320 RepID=A0ABU4WH48_9BACT|nr:class I mannose-6-phosphate isomerase [Opitutales bacterium CLA-KB-P66]